MVDAKKRFNVADCEKRMKTCDLDHGKLEVIIFLGGYTECHWCTFSALPGCDDMIWAEL